MSGRRGKWNQTASCRVWWWKSCIFTQLSGLKIWKTLTTGGNWYERRFLIKNWFLGRIARSHPGFWCVMPMAIYRSGPEHMVWGLWGKYIHSNPVVKQFIIWMQSRTQGAEIVVFHLLIIPSECPLPFLLKARYSGLWTSTISRSKYCISLHMNKCPKP